MTSTNTSEDLKQGRTWLNRAAEMLDSCEDHRSDAEFARAAAIIGNGFIALAHAERAAVSMAETSQMRQAILTMSDEPETTLGEAIEREKAIAREERLEAEARPHDDEPGQVFIVSDGPIHSWYAAESHEKARAWADRDRDGLVVTTVAVDRG
jgi:uncharacterized protein YegL